MAKVININPNTLDNVMVDYSKSKYPSYYYNVDITFSDGYNEVSYYLGSGNAAKNKATLVNLKKALELATALFEKGEKSVEAAKAKAKEETKSNSKSIVKRLKAQKAS